MQSIDVVTKSLERALSEFPGKRKKTVEALSDTALDVVRATIAGKLNDSHGKIAGWQHKRVGDKGGYGVIEAVGGQDAHRVAPMLPSSGDGSPGAITNAIEHGFKTRKAHDKSAKSYRRGRRSKEEVEGRFFYRASADKAEQLAQQAANELCAELAAIIEGDG
ncbi:MAG: hypothetical protein IKZ82_10895 [Clostridia bacterium]|nr:hypothetical protein [Clostridia bacterium]